MLMGYKSSERVMKELSRVVLRRRTLMRGYSSTMTTDRLILTKLMIVSNPSDHVEVWLVLIAMAGCPIS